MASCTELPVVLASTSSFATRSSSSSSSSSSPPARHVSAPRCRRRRRVLYPACQRRRPPLQEAPDQALRWLLLLSALVLLQIFSEDTHTCSELQSQSPDEAAEGDGGPGTAQGLNPEEPFRVQAVGTPSENQGCAGA